MTGVETPRQMAAARFAKGDRVRTPNGREGTVTDVNVYAAAVVGVQLDGARGTVSPWMFFDLTNTSRPAH